MCPVFECHFWHPENSKTLYDRDDTNKVTAYVAIPFSIFFIPISNCQHALAHRIMHMQMMPKKNKMKISGSSQASVMCDMVP